MSLRSCGHSGAEHGSTKLGQEPKIAEGWQCLRKMRQQIQWEGRWHKKKISWESTTVIQEERVQNRLTGKSQIGNIIGKKKIFQSSGVGTWSPVK